MMTPRRVSKRWIIPEPYLPSYAFHDPDSDEKRPYEFGFTIDGEQHRYEKKDEKGIIMGEFGFITADGIYHVTVYATDENGDFKIISMKNIKVGFPPGKTTTTTPKPAAKGNINLNGIRGCSGCLIPESSSTMVPKGYASGNKAFGKTDVKDNRNSNVNKGPQIFGSTPVAGGIGKNVPPSYQNYGSELQNKGGPQYKATSAPGTIPNNIPDQVYAKPLAEKIPTPVNLPGTQLPTKPVAEGLTPNFIQNQINATPVKAKSQPQLNEMEMKILDYMAKLYKFNYTLSFHGHEETGDWGGNKNGSYFANGRDGYQRKVVYIANEFGYQPRISLIKLDDEFIPKEESEKELTKLKGSEFVWFYEKK